MEDNKKTKKPDALKRLLSVIKSWKNLTITKKPDSPDFEKYRNWNQTESEYEKEQKEWMKKFKKKQLIALLEQPAKYIPKL